MDHVYQSIQGWFHAADLYREMVDRATDGAHFVEVGAWKGQSAAFMAVEIANSGKRIQFDVVDNFAGDDDPRIVKELPTDKPLFEHFLDNMRAHGLLAYCRPIPVESPRAARLYDDASLDFVYLDASHNRAEVVTADINAWLPKVKLRGILAGDDHNEESVRKAVAPYDHTVSRDGLTWRMFRWA